jgi:hypothetical protein
MSTIAHKLQAVELTIQAACAAANRPREAVQLLAVSKTFGVDAVLEAITSGQNCFGENYLQEALDKIAGVAAVLPESAVEWHFIGPIQSNKTRPLATHFNWVHTIERLKIAQRLSEQRPDGLPSLNVCLQVNISGEASKSGVAPGDLPALAREVASLSHIKLRGLMAIPEPETDVSKQRAAFAQVRALFDQLNHDGFALDTLSMGMSADMGAAIAEGATIVRVGSAIFGARDYA